MGDNSQTTQQQQNQQTNPWAPTIPGLNNIIGQINSVGTGLTPGQSTALNSVMSASGQIPNQGGQVAGMWNTLLNPNWMDPYTNPELAPAINSLNQGIQEQIGSQFSMAGRDPAGSAQAQKAIAMGESQADLPLLLNQFNTNVGQSMAAGVEGAPATAAAYMAAPEAALSGANQAFTQPFANIGSAESLLAPIAGLGGQGFMNGTSTTTQPVNPWTTGAGIGLGLLAMSDENLKENIEPVGKLDNDLTVYRYNFKGESTPQIGLLAQDVEKVKPEAVVDVPVGMWGGRHRTIKAVNYQMATAA